MVGGKIYRSQLRFYVFLMGGEKHSHNFRIIANNKHFNKTIYIPYTLDSIIRHIVLWTSLWVLSIIIKKYIPEVIGKSRN